MHRSARLVLVLVLTSLSPLALAAPPQSQAPAPAGPAKAAPLVVTGRGAATFTPRNVQIRMQLTTKAQKAEASRSQNSTKVDALKSDLATLPGLKATAIKLNAPSTHKDVDYDANGNEIFKGWVTTQSVVVTTRARTAQNLSGKVFDKGTTHSAEISPPAPVISDKAVEGARQRAENQALKNATRRAEKMAQTLGRRLTGVTAVREATETFSPRGFGAESLRAASAPSSAPTQFDVGKQTINESRTLEFQLD